MFCRSQQQFQSDHTCSFLPAPNSQLVGAHGSLLLLLLLRSRLLFVSDPCLKLLLLLPLVPICSPLTRPVVGHKHKHFTTPRNNPKHVPPTCSFFPAPNSQLVGAHVASLLLLLRSRPLFVSEPCLKLLLLPRSSPLTKPVVDVTAVLTAPVTVVTAPSAPCRIVQSATFAEMCWVRWADLA
jgi:hypothetical protein